MNWFKKALQSIVDFFKKLSNSNNNTTDPDVPANPADPADPVNQDTPTTTPVSGADEVPFADLVWSYGGFKGAGTVAIPESVIKNLTFKGNTLYYGWVKGGCENFGASNANDHTRTICAVFFKNDSGKYIGGKFDWISTDRLSRGVLLRQTLIEKVIATINRKRGLENVHGGYSGWNVGNVKNPADAAFVICGVSSPGGSGSSGKRTNVIKGVWAR
jgi:hypothetical protein